MLLTQINSGGWAGSLRRVKLERERLFFTGSDHLGICELPLSLSRSSAGPFRQDGSLKAEVMAENQQVVVDLSHALLILDDCMSR